ncbi:MAG: type III pantothenate kinase [Muribaculaceae bacterium]|nr:type III pantothenate kinase [Muribaculaceae bacterium]
MTNLTLDIGNSVSKIDIWNGETLLFHENSNNLSIEEILKLIEKFNVSSSIISEVGKENKELKIFLKELLGDNFIEFRPEFLLGHHIHYSSQLGVDRLAAFLGAIELYPDIPLLIVDAGTALTVDIVNREGDFCGGNISLGLASRLKAIHEMTSRLPEVSAEGFTSMFGNDTESALRNGAVNGIVGEIIFDFNNARNLYGCETILFTGGDAPKIIPVVEKEGVACEYDKYLVSRGLNYFMGKTLALKQTHRFVD